MKRKLTRPYWFFYPTKSFRLQRGWLLLQTILQAGVGTLIKGINALVDAKRAKAFNNAIKMVTENVELTHQRLMTLENRMSMMAKAIIPALDDLKSRITNTNQKLTS